MDNGRVEIDGRRGSARGTPGGPVGRGSYDRGILASPDAPGV